MDSKTRDRKTLNTDDFLLRETLWNSGPGSVGTGLRERKKAALRQFISNVATQLFLDKGFDAVHVKDIAKACDVSEKTIYNYFPVKEALLLDREEVMVQALKNAFAKLDLSPTQAMAELLRTEIESMANGLQKHTSPNHGIAMVRQFLQLIQTHPTLSMYQQNIMERLVDTTAELLSQRNHVSADAPETRIAAEMLIGLWNLQHRALRKFIANATDLTDMTKTVNKDVTKAIAVVENGLSSINS